MIFITRLSGGQTNRAIETNGFAVKHFVVDDVLSQRLTTITESLICMKLLPPKLRRAFAEKCSHAFCVIL